MDVKDVSFIDGYVSILQQNKHALQNAAKRKGEVPKDRLPRTRIISNHMAHYYSSTAASTSYTHQIHSTLVAAPYAASTAPLTSLQKINIADLALETHHRGRYMSLRSVTPPTRMTALMAVVEDEKMDATNLQIFQQEIETEKAALDIFPQGTVCIVREPYFKLTADGNYGLRVDHVSDIQWLRGQDKRLPMLWRSRIEKTKTADEWKLDGNLSLKDGKYRAALEK